ncbi:MAG: MFS transporter [Nanoarchaeota archaeon]|nr:MFS transporter [Nanoarchaeota archaeon]MBU1135222.1 MFS transporter [Nanoarchaeota archaeon]MBU2519861.1 MFS transporter [Nanoarchaeota archaeon]
MYIFDNIFKGNVELKELYLNRIIDYFAISLIGIFIPIYLLTIGFALMHVFQYFVVVWGTMTIMNFLAAHVSSFFGLKKTIMLRVPMLLAFLFLLTNLDALPSYFLYLTAIAAGTSLAFYWVPLNSFFTRNADRKKEGLETGYLSALPRIFVMFAPLLGGIMLEEFGFHSVFIMVMVLAVLSVVPLAITGDKRLTLKYDRKKGKLAKKLDGLSSIIVIQGILAIVEFVVWPIFIFISLNDLLSVGIAGTLSIFGVGIFTLMVGKFSDKVEKKNIVRLGAVLLAAIWFMRIFSTSVMEFFLLSFIAGLCLALIDVPIFAIFSRNAKKNPLAMNISRELHLNMGRLIILFIMLAFLLMFSTTSLFPFAFAFAGIMALGLLVV